MSYELEGGMTDSDSSSAAASPECKRKSDVEGVMSMSSPNVESLVTRWCSSSSLDADAEWDVDVERWDEGEPLRPNLDFALMPIDGASRPSSGPVDPGRRLILSDTPGRTSPSSVAEGRTREVGIATS